MFIDLKEKIKKHPHWKAILLRFLIHPVKTRPQWWIRLFLFMYVKKGKGAVFYSNTRKDLVPFHRCNIGKKSVIESYSCLNNMVGDIWIGSFTRIGISNTVIGPVKIGNHVNLAQNVVVSGLNHNYQNPEQTISSQGVNTALITIDDDVWIGANAVLLAGINIGSHSVIAAGSIVTHDVPPFSIVAGNPARVIKHYDSQTQQWIKIQE